MLFLAFLTLCFILGFPYYMRHKRKNKQKRSKSSRTTSNKVREISTKEEAHRASSLRLSSRKTSKQVIRIKRSNKPEWKKKGWKKRNGKLEGYYRTRYGSFKGTIILKKIPDFYIYDLPKSIKNHEHEHCFPPNGKTDNGERIYYVHFNKKPKLDGISAGIERVEKILKEVLGN